MSASRRLRDLIADNEEWLTRRIIHYAKERGYTPFTSTLEQAWLASIRGLSAPLIAALDEGRDFGAVFAQADYARDPIARYGVEAARRHRTRGITLGLFLGLMKSYRQTYLDLVTGADVRPGERRANRGVVDSFFDRMEVAFSEEWAGKPADEQFEQLRVQNWLITNEKNKYLTIFESLNDPVILVDEHGRIENVNYAAATLFAGRATPGASYYGGDQARVDESLGDILGEDILAAETPLRERLLPTTIGSRWFDIKTQRMLDVSEKYLGAVVILNDVTEYRRAREEAERADRAKSAFLATMSHEIRTPIHGILGLAELLRRGRLAARERGYVEAIARSGEALSSVVSDILDYSKIEAGVLDLENVEFSTRSVIEDVFDLMAPLARRKPDLRLVVEAPDLPKVVGDPGKLRQILLNLVGNAVKFTERGSVRLVVEDLTAAEGPRTLRFTVEDTGIGVAEDRQAAIFEPFTQSEGSVARRYGGSGLGLAICRRLAQRLGGEIGVESRLGEGSRFRFTAPFAAVAEAKFARVAAAPIDETLRALDLLVVEDNEVNAMVARGLLERVGHRVVVAPSGAAALAEVDARRFDVVLMDLRLPDIDGLETTRRIRAHADPQKSRVPVVILSAQVTKRDIEASIEAGVDDFVGKPFRLERLEATLRRVAAPAAGDARSRRRAAGSTRQDTVARPPAAAPQPTVDDVVLAEHAAALGVDQAARIVAAFQASVVGAPAEIERLAACQDRRGLAEIAHRLKSSSLHVGLAHLSSTAEALELAAREGTGDIEGLAGALAAACREAPSALDKAVMRLKELQPANT